MPTSKYRDSLKNDTGVADNGFGVELSDEETQFTLICNSGLTDKYHIDKMSFSNHETHDERRITDFRVPLIIDFIDGDKTNHKRENIDERSRLT